MAAPISAKSASWRAVAPMLAPRSSTMLGRAMVGHWPAMAGRSMPGMVLSTSLAMAIRAPVLPAETVKSASPFCTASMRQPHAGAAPAAHGLARLVLHLHDRVGVHDARALGELRDAARDGARCAPGRRTAGSSRRDGARARARPRARPRRGPRSPPIASSDMVRGVAMTPSMLAAVASLPSPAERGCVKTVPTAAPPKTTDHSLLQARNNQIFGPPGGVATRH